jgi:hypothetical protein
MTTPVVMSSVWPLLSALRAKGGRPYDKKTIASATTSRMAMHASVKASVRSSGII